MNIEKLAKHLKEFTLDEIDMITEYDCKTELEHLLNENKLVFEQGLYKYKEPEHKRTFDLFAKPELKTERILFKDMAAYYLTSRNLTRDTITGYKARLKHDIIPEFGDIYVDKITYKMLADFANKMKLKHKAKTASNCITLLGSIFKAAFLEGYLKINPYLGVINAKCK